ncbi:hypothetical protein B0H13DRAFT_1959882 [Mycena leptocephala]|nr:hypothetical protein B0H13DRAFT_1959882 [Mycena leptocephala]
MHAVPVVLFIWAIGSVNGYVPRQDPSGTASAVSALVTPALAFNKIPEMTTCSPALITWMYSPVTSDDPLELTLFITNAGVAQISAPASTATGTFTPNVARAVERRDTVTYQITSVPINPASRMFIWSSVNVTEGWYAMIGTIPLANFNQQSTPFYVENGVDVSCISSSSSSSPSSPSRPNPRQVALHLVGIPRLPLGEPGAIAGGVIGGLAVVAAAIAAYFYLRYASASTASGASPNRAPANGPVSVPQTPKPRLTRRIPVCWVASGRHHSQSDSIGPMLSHDSDVYVIGTVGIDSRPSRIHDTREEEDEVNSYFSPSQEKISSPSHGSPIRSPFSESGHGHEDAVPLDFITPLPGTGVTRNSSTSTSSYMNNNFSRPRSHPSSPYSGSPTTAEGPFSDNAQNNTASSLGNYPPTPSPAFPSGTSQTISEAPPRRGSAGEPIGAPTRRTPRKPVPQYNPTDPSLVSPPFTPQSLPAVYDSDSSREGSLRDGRLGPQDLPKLNHKASFGAEGRPVHYLIPDMPPPPRE